MLRIAPPLVSVWGWWTPSAQPATPVSPSTSGKDGRLRLAEWRAPAEERHDVFFNAVSGINESPFFRKLKGATKEQTISTDYCTEKIFDNWERW